MNKIFFSYLGLNVSTGGASHSEYKPPAAHGVRWNVAGLYIPKMQKYHAFMGYSEDYIAKMQRFNRFQIIFVP